MNNNELKKLVDVAAGRTTADIVIKNCKVVDVYNARIINGDIAICDELIAGVGKYQGKQEINAHGQYALPGFIDGHIHIESSYVSPEELGRLLVPHGATTIIADPHEIVNVCGVKGLRYMMSAAKETALDIKFMLPSCVPATPFENSGAVIDAETMAKLIGDEGILGLGEFMDYPGVINANDEVINKLLVAINNRKLIDGHCPSVEGNDLNAYSAVGILTEHECTTVKEMSDRLARGIYILLRQGSACHELRTLLKAVTPLNSRRCLFCSDDRQPKTILEFGHLDEHLRICAQEGIDPMIAIQMASLNAAECYRLKDRGAIAPGLRADIVLLDNLTDFNVHKVFIKGVEVASNGKYALPIKPYDIASVQSSFYVKDFSLDKLKLNLSSSHINVIDIIPGGGVTAKGTANVKLNKNQEFEYDPNSSIAKIAVVERHKKTGNVAVALIRGYGISSGAIALSIAHDSHNVIVVGVNDKDIELAVNKLIAQEGGVVLVKNNKILETMPMPIGGLMSNHSGEWVNEKLTKIHEIAYEELGISRDVDPVMTLSFMSLAVIPELKITDMGLFDVTKFDFIPVEVLE